MNPHTIFAIFVLLFCLFCIFFDRGIIPVGDGKPLSRTSEFQGLRVIAIWGIVNLHAGYQIFGGGDVLCSFFFILSGFLFKGLQNHEGWLYYFWRKCKQIFPLYWLCLLLFLIVYGLYDDPKADIRLDILPHLFLIQSWWPDCDGMAYLGPSWFLSSLLFCYLLSPFLHKIINFNIWIAICISILVYYFCQSQTSHWWTYVSPFYRLSEYVAGMCLREVIFYKNRKKEVNPVVSIFVFVSWLFMLRYCKCLFVVELSHLFIIGYLYMFFSKGLHGLLVNRMVDYISPNIIFIFLAHIIFFPIVNSLFGYYPLTVSFVAFFLSLLLGICYHKIMIYFK